MNDDRGPDHRRGGKKGGTQFKARRFPSPQSASRSSTGLVGAAVAPGPTTASQTPSSTGGPTASSGAGGMTGTGSSARSPVGALPSAPAHGFVTLHKSPTTKDATAGFPTLVARGSTDYTAGNASGSAVASPTAASPTAASSGSGHRRLVNNNCSVDSMSEFSNVSPVSNSLSGFPLMHRGNSISQLLGSPNVPGRGGGGGAASASGLPMAEKRVSVFFPRRSSEGELNRGDALGFGPGADGAGAGGEANEDRMQVRVEGYYDSDTGVLIPSDLPKSTLLYVLTASDGRDLLFKTVQYNLQLLICLLKTPSLFSPDSAPLLDAWAVRLWKNYNTIRHGRSLFKMGRGILNLFTLQTVCERMWMRYGDAVAERFAPLTAFLAMLVEPARRAGAALGLPGCGKSGRSSFPHRIKAFPGEGFDAGREESVPTNDITPNDSKASSPVDGREDATTTADGWGLRSYLWFLPLTTASRSASQQHGRRGGKADGRGGDRSGRAGGPRHPTTSSVSTGGLGANASNRSKNEADTLVTDDTFVHVSRVERLPGFTISPTQRVPTYTSPTGVFPTAAIATAAAAVGNATSAHPPDLGFPQSQQPPQPQSPGLQVQTGFGGGVNLSANLSPEVGASPASRMPFYIKAEHGLSAFVGHRSPLNVALPSRYASSSPPPPSSSDAAALAAERQSPLPVDLAAEEARVPKFGSTYAGSTFDLRVKVQRQLEEQRRRAALEAEAAGADAAPPLTVSVTDGFAAKGGSGGHPNPGAYGDDGTAPPTPITADGGTAFGSADPTAPPSPSVAGAAALVPPVVHGNRSTHSDHNNTSMLYSPMLPNSAATVTTTQQHPAGVCGRVQGQHPNACSFDDDQDPPTLPGTLPQTHFGSAPHPFAPFAGGTRPSLYETGTGVPAGSGVAGEAPTPLSSSKPDPHGETLAYPGKSAPLSASATAGATSTANGGAGGAGSQLLLRPLCNSAEHSTSSCGDGVGGASHGPSPFLSSTAAAQDHRTASTNSSLPDALGLPGQKPPLPTSTGRTGTTGLFPISPFLSTGTATSLDKDNADYFTSCRSMPYDENLGSQLRKRESTERRRSKLLSRSLNLAPSMDADANAAASLTRSRRGRGSKPGSMSSSQVGTHPSQQGTASAGAAVVAVTATAAAAAAAVASRAPDSLGSSYNPEPSALWAGIGGTPLDEANDDHGSQPPLPMSGREATEAFYTRYCDDEQGAADRSIFGKGESSGTGSAAGNANAEDASSSSPPRDPHAEDAGEDGEGPFYRAYDDSDVSLNSSSINEEEKNDADDEAFAYRNDELEPAAAAEPARWRKGPMNFDPLLMSLVGVRNLAAAIRRFLRDLTLVSSERFFVLEFVERNRTSIHRRINYLWLIVSIIDLSLNTIRLAKPGWGAYAMARQNTLCRCGCRGRDDPDDVVWHSNGLIARQKKDLFFPPLDLDYGAPYTSNTAYVEAADPIHMQPACSRCGCLYKEVINYANVHQPESDKPRWLQVYDAEIARNATEMHKAQQHVQQHLQRRNTGNPYLAQDAAAPGSAAAGGGVGGKEPTALVDDVEVIPVEVKATINASTFTVERSVVCFNPAEQQLEKEPAKQNDDGKAAAGADASHGGSAAQVVHHALAYVHQGGAGTVTADAGHALHLNPHQALLPAPAAAATSSAAVVKRPAEAESSIGFLLLPFLMRKLFNYVWLLRVHPNLTSTLLLQLRYMAELFLAYKYCFGNYEPSKTDAPLHQILNPGGAVAGIISAAVGLLRVIESAPK